jgi:hypothetical protein
MYLITVTLEIVNIHKRTSLVTNDVATIYAVRMPVIIVSLFITNWVVKYIVRQ